MNLKEKKERLKVKTKDNYPTHYSKIPAGVRRENREPEKHKYANENRKEKKIKVEPKNDKPKSNFKKEWRENEVMRGRR